MRIIEPSSSFMPHAMLEAYNIKLVKLLDVSSERPFLEALTAYCDAFLKELIKVIDMDLVGGPFYFPYYGLRPLDSYPLSLSCFCIIATSHISLHVFCHEEWLALDVFSCKAFSIAKVVDLVDRTFSQDIDLHETKRATRSPRPLGA